MHPAQYQRIRELYNNSLTFPLQSIDIFSDLPPNYTTTKKKTTLPQLMPGASECHNPIFRSQWLSFSKLAMKKLWQSVKYLRNSSLGASSSS